MVEQSYSLDAVFGSLADPTRRDIMSRLLGGALSVGEIAQPYDVSLAAISKHLKVLERAKLIRKVRRGKQQLVMVQPLAIKGAEGYLREWEAFWNEQFNKIDQF